MNKIVTAIGAASLLALTACGSSGEEAANNIAATDNLALPADESLEPLPGTLGNEANALDANLSTNSVDANLSGNSADLNASSNALGNTSASSAGTANSQ